MVCVGLVKLCVGRVLVGPIAIGLAMCGPFWYAQLCVCPIMDGHFTVVSVKYLVKLYGSYAVPRSSEQARCDLRFVWA
jgi:hypothetical protein